MKLSIRRTVVLPLFVNRDNILALIELGGKLFTKEKMYIKFFEHGVEGVKKDIVSELVKRGGSQEDFSRMLKEQEKRFRTAV